MVTGNGADKAMSEMSFPKSSPVFDLVEGDSPLLISVPHCGSRIPGEICGRMRQAAIESTDSDWLVDRLYGFAAGSGHAIQTARYSRYVIDLNRPPNQQSLYPGQFEVALCPLQGFDGKPLYRSGCEPSEEEIDRRINHFWKPYHDNIRFELEQRVERFGYALLWDAHSIRSSVPLLFEGTLPDLSFGTNSDLSCDPALLQSVLDVAAGTDAYSVVANQRFRGGYITRHYGSPEQNIHAIQLEISQATYLDESVLENCADDHDQYSDRVERAWHADRADRLSELLGNLLSMYVSSASASQA